MCNSLDGSHSRATTRTAAIFAHEMRSLPAGSSRSHSSARPVPRHNASAKYIAKSTRAFDPDALQTNRYRHMLAAVIEQLRLLRCPDQPASQRPRLNPAMLVDFAKMRHRLLDDTMPDTHTAY
jgi:hypothetical protein